MNKYGTEDAKVSILAENKSSLRVILRSSLNKNTYLNIDRVYDRKVANLKENVRSIFSLDDNQNIKFIFKGKILDDGLDISSISIIIAQSRF